MCNGRLFNQEQVDTGHATWLFAEPVNNHLIPTKDVDC